MVTDPVAIRECVKTQESHPREWVDFSDPTYQKQRGSFGNPAHGSGWIVQVQPFPVNFRSLQAGSEQSTHSRGWNSKTRSPLFVGRT